MQNEHMEKAAAVLSTVAPALDIAQPYMVMAVCTTAFSPEKDQVIAVGVQARGVDAPPATQVVFNWFAQPEEVDRVREKLAAQAQAYQRDNVPVTYTEEYVRSNGLAPETAARQIHTALQTVAEKRMPLICHGLLLFSQRFLDTLFARFELSPIPWDDINIIDTGLLERAVQQGRWRSPEEPLHLWKMSVQNSKGGAYNLGKHCVGVYGLAQTASEPTAIQHCALTDQLFHIYQEIANGNGTGITADGKTREAGGSV